MFLFVRLHLFKEGHERVGIVAGLVHVLQSQIIRFRFRGSRKLQEGDRQRQVQSLINSITRPAAWTEHDQRDGGQLHDLALGGVACAVARANVRDLVGHHSGHFRFFVGAQDQPAIYVEKSAGQCERVHLIGIDHLDRERHLGVRVAHQVLAHAVHIFGDYRIIDKLRGAVHFLRELFAQRNLVLQGIKIRTVADLAVSNCVHVRFASRFRRGLLHARRGGVHGGGCGSAVLR